MSLVSRHRSAFAAVARALLVAITVVVGCTFDDYTFGTAVDEAEGGPDASTGGGATTGGGGGASPGGAAGADASAGGVGGLPMGGAGAGGRLDAAVDAPTDAYVPECVVNDDCTASPRRTICDAARGVCVECWPGLVPCAEGLYCSDEKTCEIGCESDLTCALSGQIPGYQPPEPEAGADAAVEAGVGDAAAEGGDAARPAPVEAGADANTDAGLDAAADADADAPPVVEPPFVPDGGPLVCRASDRRCVGCREDADCPAGTLCRAGVCENGCHAGHPCPSDYSCCGGVCADLSDDPRYCGSCDTRCDYPGAFGVCAEGQCSIGTCRPGFADCNADLSRGELSDGCEIDTRSDRDNCGGCTALSADPAANFRCDNPPNASAACRSSECTFDRCLTDFENCDDDTSNGCEVNLLASTLNCGVCGAACSLPNSSPRCVAASCIVVSCLAGFADCDSGNTNGCEVNTQTDPANCGSCGKVCSLDGADSTCFRGSCRIAGCIAPNLDCNATASDGCEVNGDTDPANCGGCFAPCTLPNATAGCAAGACVIASCSPGFADCDGNPANGCEVNLDTSVNNCGACDAACSDNNGTRGCALGVCQITCDSGFDDCDSDLSNGCEIDTRSNIEHCNTCDLSCPAGAGETANCVAGVCGISSCGGSTADCNGQSGDGCEVNTNTDVNNCGGCGKRCFVANGVPACSSGACAVASCNAGFGDCDGLVANGCEARLNTLSDCGSCDQVCALPSAQPTCVTGSCKISFCNTSTASCDGDDSNGCETNTLSDLANCGGCGNACSTNHGTPLCGNGVCQITCDSGFGNCNASVSDGCELATRDDPLNCGGCGVVCGVKNGQAGCNGTTCTVGSCTPPFADCDGFYATGCEVNKNDNEKHCGACGNLCQLAHATSICLTGVCEIDLCDPPWEDCDGDPANGCEVDGACP